MKLTIPGLLCLFVAFLAMPASAERAVQLPKGFSEKTVEVNGVKIHFMLGGKGPAVVLLHGYAQTSRMWKPLMPVLASTHTVIVPDLRGAGGSERTPGGYDKKNMAKDMRELVRRLGHGKVSVVGHDIGLMVAYAYAAQYPAEVDRVILMDAFLPGVGKWQDVWLLRDLWHFHFHGETPLALVKGRERIYFEHFWNDFAADRTKSVSEADRRIYARAYARDDGMRAGFEYFKNFEQDAKDFAEFSANKLDMPFLVLTGEKASGTFLIDQAKLVANDVTGTVVKGSGHWLMDEATDQVVPAIAAFLNRKAMQGRTADDPKLVWTASQVALISREVAPGVYAVFPDDAEAKNKAGVPVATSGGFVVGDDAVLVVESMLNRRLATQMMTLVGERTRKPIRYVVNTSYHGDHSYGNQFFPRSVRFIQHRKTQEYIASHFKDDVDFMSRHFGSNQGLNELRPQSADLLLSDGGRLDVDLGGKRVQILHLGFAQTTGDLFVWLADEKVLYTGNPVIASAPALPWLLDGRLNDSLETLTRLRRMLPDDAIVVPGHGAPVDPGTIDFTSLISAG